MIATTVNDNVPGPSFDPKALRMNVVETIVFTENHPICKSPMSKPGIRYPPVVPKVELPTTYSGYPVCMPSIAGAR